MAKKMIIVGAGISGLSTGCYAQMNGYKTTILEMHSIPGGLCTAWKRKGYTFDISMHMLNGSKSGPLNTMWQELGILHNREFFYHKSMGVVESGKKSVDICTDAQRLKEQLLALSPGDSKLIKEFVQLVSGRDMMGAFSLKPDELTHLFDKLKMIWKILPLLGTFSKYGKSTIQEYAERFQDPFLRTVIRFFIDSPGWPMQRFPMVGLAGFIKSSVLEAGVPLGGSQKVVYSIAENYENLGGEILYNSRVKKVLVQNDRAVGVRLEDGTEFTGDDIVWAGDGHTAIFDMLGGRYLSDEIKNIYNKWIPTQPMIHVCLGVNRDMSGEPNRILWELEKPINIAGQDHWWLCFLHHCFDKSMAPAGKSAVEVWYATQYDYWEKLAQNRKEYEEQKKRIADFTIAELEKRWPGFASQIEVVDVPTPVTYTRYTGTWQGSPDGWYITPENMNKQKMLSSLPGLSNFYMVGQWTAPFTGTVMAALSGRRIVQLLCKRNKKRFKTTA